MQTKQLLSLAATVAGERQAGDVFEAIVKGIAQQRGIALARIWIISAGDLCATCSVVTKCRDRARCLQLVASAGTSLNSVEQDWTSLGGSYRRIPLNTPRIGTIATSGDSILINDFALENDWVAESDWVRREGVRGFAGQPLIFHGKILGVLAIFSRVHLDDEDFAWLRIFADQGAVAITNARASEELVRTVGASREYAGQVQHVIDVAPWRGVRIDINNQKQAQERTLRENIALREEIDNVSMFEEIVGTSRSLQAVLSRVIKVARTDSTALITGETGTGKELIARAIHKRSHRADQAFISANCAAIPRDLIASELFGHEKGAFTGALQRRVGRFELAEGGTIFLDEIGELPPETQIALLRVLQEREFQRVGGNKSIRTNARVIAATNRDLPGAIAAGTFRSDLFYRINVFPIHIPPLRERKEDIRLLVEYFIDRYSSKAGKKIRRIEKKSLDQIQSYPWPGNIRELQNVIERSVILCETEDFSVDESWLPQEAVTHRPLSDELFEQEKEMIEYALTKTGGRVSGPSGAAIHLGMPPSTLDSKIKILKIDKHRFHCA